jgi:hypothetical protein
MESGERHEKGIKVEGEEEEGGEGADKKGTKDEGEEEVVGKEVRQIPEQRRAFPLSRRFESRRPGRTSVARSPRTGKTG